MCNIRKLTHYLIELEVQMFVKCYEFLSFAKNKRKNSGKNVSKKTKQKILDLTEILKEKHISAEKRQQMIDDLISM